MRHGMYWSGDLAYRDADGWIYLAGRTGDWMRVDGENMAAAPIERILVRLPDVRRTPTVFVLGPQGQITRRASGLPSRGDVLAAVVLATDGPVAGRRE